MSSSATASRETLPSNEGMDSLSWRLAMGTRLNSWAAKLRGGGTAQWPAATAALFLEAASLGIMRRRDVDAMVCQTYASRPEFYHPGRYHLPYEREMITGLLSLRSPCRLLDAFCGQGREAELFAKAGYEVTAIDQFDWMIAAARRYANEVGFETNFVTADFGSFKPEQAFDVVYTSVWMLSTMQGTDRRAQFLCRCEQLCSPNGTTIVSFINSTADSAVGALLRFAIAKTAAFITLGNFRTQYGERIYTGLFWHHLSTERLRKQVQSAGWRVVKCIDASGMAPTFWFLQRENSGMGQ